MLLNIYYSQLTVIFLPWKETESDGRESSFERVDESPRASVEPEPARNDDEKGPFLAITPSVKAIVCVGGNECLGNSRQENQKDAWIYFKKLENFEN